MLSPWSSTRESSESHLIFVGERDPVKNYPRGMYIIYSHIYSNSISSTWYNVLLNVFKGYLSSNTEIYRSYEAKV